MIWDGGVGVVGAGGMRVMRGQFAVMSGVMRDVVGKGVDCEECVTGEMLRTG